MNMIEHEYCSFCGKKFEGQTLTNGEHLFPAFACKKIFGTSTGSKKLQERIKIKVCQDCNSHYGSDLEAKLKNIINAISNDDKKFLFRTEEALTLLNYMTKTRVLLSFKQQHKLFKPTLGNYNRVKNIASFDRQLIVLKGPVPDGIYIPRAIPKINMPKDCEFLSTENTDFLTCFAVVINGVILVSFENKLACTELGFPYTSIAWGKKQNVPGILVQENGEPVERLWVNGTNNVEDLWFWDYLQQEKLLSSFILAQPRTLNFVNDYTKKYVLSKNTDGYRYGIYYKNKDKSSWLTKANNEKGAKGIDISCVQDSITLPELENFLKLISMAELWEWEVFYWGVETGYPPEKILTELCGWINSSEIKIENILAFDVNEKALYNNALKVLETSGLTKQQIIDNLYTFIENLNKRKVTDEPRSIEELLSKNDSYEHKR